MTTFAEAQNLILEQARPFKAEQVALVDAIDRILAQPIYADRDYPPFNRAMMDGYAVQSADFGQQTAPELQIIEYLPAGRTALQTITSGTCAKIMTGAPVPEGADAVVRIEDTHAVNKQVSFLINAVKPGQNIAYQAEDAEQGSLLLARNHLITPQIMSVLAVTGNKEVTVLKPPSVGIVSTGNEVVSVENHIQSHQIRDSNAWVLRSFLRKYQITNVEAVLVADSKRAISQTIQRILAEKDIVFVSGGVSKGDADYVPEVLQSLGVQQIFHRVRIKPGGPIWFGITADGKAVFGLPGNPVSVQVGCKVFIEPYLRACFGLASLSPLFLPFLETRSKKTSFDEFFPCELVTHDDSTSIRPVRYNSSGDISATAHSEGIAWHPAATEQLTPQTPIAFYAWG